MESLLQTAVTFPVQQQLIWLFSPAQAADAAATANGYYVVIKDPCGRYHHVVSKRLIEIAGAKQPGLAGRQSK